jgi:Tfp pilus assembly PilM family ATPase
MFQLLAGKPGLGIEITSSAIRLAAVARRRADISVLAMKTVELPSGMVGATYSSPNVRDHDEFSALLRDCLTGISLPVIRRAALSLPDGVFRVQTIEFDELPAKTADRERLIRWRIEKTAAIDAVDTVLRYQVLKGQDKGFTVLACFVKQAVLAQYEAALVAVGLEPWSVGPSSFHTLNFYAPFITAKTAVSALAYITEDSFATIVLETNGARFYRYKEIKRSGAGEGKARFIREIDDSLHLYTHMDRTQRTEVRGLYLTGEADLPSDLADGLGSLTSLEVQVLSPSVIIPSANGSGPEMAAALGAGCSL